jgi:hypothetical protein
MKFSGEGFKTPSFLKLKYIKFIEYTLNYYSIPSRQMIHDRDKEAANERSYETYEVKHTIKCEMQECNNIAPCLRYKTTVRRIVADDVLGKKLLPQ